MEKEEYKELIIKMLEKLEDISILKKIYTAVKVFQIK